MNRISIFLLLFMLASSANSTLVEPVDVSIDANRASNFELDVVDTENNETTQYKLPMGAQMLHQTDTAPPTSWIIGLGLCLVFIGYRMKNNSH